MIIFTSKLLSNYLMILLAPELPELTFTSDKHRLYQVLLNFVTNALKFTSKGSIVIDYRINRNEVRFSVQDTGMGIEPEKQEAIFTRGERFLFLVYASD